NSLYAIYVQSANNTISSNRIFNNSFGLYLNSTAANLVYDNLFNDTSGLYVAGSGNLFNATLGRTRGISNIAGGPYIGGNFWALPGGTGYSETCPDLNRDGICDDPVSVAGGSVDYLPLSVYNPDITRPVVTLLLPPNNLRTNDTSLNFSFSAYDDVSPNVSCILYLDGAPALSAAIPNNSVQNYSANFSIRAHYWYAACADLAGNVGVGGIWRFKVTNPDGTLPGEQNISVALLYPPDGSRFSDGNITLSYSMGASNFTGMNCSLYANGSLLSSDFPSSNSTFYYNGAFGIGQYPWYASCEDSLGNFGIGGPAYFEVSYDAITTLGAAISPSPNA
ncbi:MAG TPA: NosD domain-containing protein, partial [Candidatus Micrarchaeota archaeon]|nr:NosD domain-containing protein [Candidatus Micrarchaeota archaeon]